MYSIDPKEVYRYLGFRGAEPDSVLAGEVSACIEEIGAAADRRYAKVRVPAAVCSDAEHCLMLGGMRVISRNLFYHLKGCRECVLFAATVGIGVDRLIRRAEIGRMSKAAILQAAGAAAVEAWCDQINDGISEEAAKEGLVTVPRFSPGYGDFSLSHQAEFLRITDPQRKTGISLTEGFLMIPSKSVTAVVGLKPAAAGAVMEKSGCAACGMTGCMARQVDR